MPLRNPAPHMAGGSHLADGDRHLTASLLGSQASVTPSAVVTPTNVHGGHGVCGDADLRATAGTGTRVVAIAAGHAFIRGATNAAQGVYNVWNDASTNVTLDNGDGNPRNDLIAVRVTDADPGVGNATTAVEFVTVKGTPAASPQDPAIPTDGSYLVLARVRVPAGSWTTTTAGIIDDLRPSANGLGGIRRVRSGNRPTVGLSVGDFIYEVDTGYLLRWTGTAWQYHVGSMFVTSAQNAWPSNAGRGDLALNVYSQWPGGVPSFLNAQSAWQAIGNVRWTSQSAFDSPAFGGSLPLNAATTNLFPLQVQHGTAFWSQASPMNASGEAPLFWGEAFKNGVAAVHLAFGNSETNIAIAGINTAGAFASTDVHQAQLALQYRVLTRTGCTVRLRFISNNAVPVSPYNIRINYTAFGF